MQLNVGPHTHRPQSARCALCSLARVSPAPPRSGLPSRRICMAQRMAQRLQTRTRTTTAAVAAAAAGSAASKRAPVAAGPKRRAANRAQRAPCMRARTLHQQHNQQHLIPAPAVMCSSRQLVTALLHPLQLQHSQRKAAQQQLRQQTAVAQRGAGASARTAARSGRRAG
jgi:hypothetical protein